MSEEKSLKKIKILTFKHALDGILSAIHLEPNIKIHLAVALSVITFGFLFNISRFEWLLIITSIGLVFALELTNTAIETVVNSFTKEAHPGAKLAKDISAGAVLVVTITSVIVGLIIFLPHLT